ncbi:MAG: glycosyltransferase family 39 protein [Candidatus Melainabacteria bacterium]|nr:glycosyltransferase family 39 protein [Candidatus Melainabacteria bacterium]
MFTLNVANSKQSNYIYFLILLCLIIFFTGLGEYGLLARDEPRYCHAAYEMIQNGDFIVPQFNYEPRFDKPILYYWLIALSYKLFGINEFTSRLPSACCAILLIISTYYIGKKLFDLNTGVFSAVILATSAEYLFIGRRAATDITLCLFVSLALYTILLAHNSNNSKIKILWFISSGLCMGLGILTKGPIAIILPVGIFFIYLILTKKIDFSNIAFIILSIFISLVISLPWYAAIHITTGGEFTRAFFLEHNISRFTSVVGEHPGPPWFYIPIILGGFMPWTLFFIPAIYLNVKNFTKGNLNPNIVFMSTWAIFVFIFFSLSTTKLATYIVLLFPPLSLITAHWLNNHINLKKIKQLLLTINILLACVVPFVLVYISNSNLNQHAKEDLQKGVLIYLILYILISISILVFSKKSLTLLFSFASIYGVTAAALLTISLQTYYNYYYNDLKQHALELQKRSIKEAISFNTYQPILVFYSHAHINFEHKAKQIKLIKSAVQQNKELYVVINKSNYNNNKFISNNLEIASKGNRYHLLKTRTN